MKLTLFLNGPHSSIETQKLSNIAPTEYKLAYLISDEHRKLAQKMLPEWVPKITSFTKGVSKLIGGNSYFMSPSKIPTVAVWNGVHHTANPWRNAHKGPVIHVFILTTCNEVQLEAIYTEEAALAYKDGSTRFATAESMLNLGKAESWAAEVSELSSKMWEKNKLPQFPKHMINQAEWIKARYCAKRKIEHLI